MDNNDSLEHVIKQMIFQKPDAFEQYKTDINCPNCRRAKLVQKSPSDAACPVCGQLFKLSQETVTDY